MDLADLLVDPTAKSDEATLAAAAGQVVLVQSLDQIKKKRRQIMDVATWMQAFSVYVAALATAESTKEELAGMMAHVHVILQVHRDLGGMKWYLYDQQYREWAAATGKRTWGEMNLMIYGRCLCSQSHPSSQSSTQQVGPGKRESKKPRGKNKACFKHNFEISCGQTAIMTMHVGTAESWITLLETAQKHQNNGTLTRSDSTLLLLSVFNS